jgi:hypothetical protein
LGEGYSQVIRRGELDMHYFRLHTGGDQANLEFELTFQDLSASQYPEITLYIYDDNGLDHEASLSSDVAERVLHYTNDSTDTLCIRVDVDARVAPKHSNGAFELTIVDDDE